MPADPSRSALALALPRGGRGMAELPAPTPPPPAPPAVRSDTPLQDFEKLTRGLVGRPPAATPRRRRRSRRPASESTPSKEPAVPNGTEPALRPRILAPSGTARTGAGPTSEEIAAAIEQFTAGGGVIQKIPSQNAKPFLFKVQSKAGGRGDGSGGVNTGMSPRVANMLGIGGQSGSAPLNLENVELSPDAWRALNWLIGAAPRSVFSNIIRTAYGWTNGQSRSVCVELVAAGVAIRDTGGRIRLSDAALRAAKRRARQGAT